MVGLGVASAAVRLLLGGVLLVEDVEVGVDAVVGNGLGAEQLVEVVPLGLQPVAASLAGHDDAHEPVHDLQALLFPHFTINFHKAITNIQLFMLASLFGSGLASVVEKYTALDDPLVVPHLANMLASLDRTAAPHDLPHLSNLVKQTHPRPVQKLPHRQEALLPALAPLPAAQRDYYLRKFALDNQRLQWAGVGLLREEAALIDLHLSAVAEKYKARQVRFWGKILGVDLDYYVVQGVVGEVASLEQAPKGAEKRGEGANYYTFWVANNLPAPEWIELPQITPQQVRTARKIKRYFSGHLDRPVKADPPFPGEERHYLKAQLARITHSLELAPKGIFKPNDENPKLVDFEDEPKVPEFAEMVTLEAWAHRNQNILNLGRCTHYIDPALPEDQIEAATAELAEKDPEVERLRGITEDKLPEGSSLGVENVWQLRAVGDSQVFQKEEAAFVYGAVVLKNLHWPGWVTLGYKGGYCNFYLGSGHKLTQPAWNQYENAALGEEGEEAGEYPEPNPKEEPKPVEVVVVEAAEQ